MPQSFASLHLHIVFSTKNREPFLTPELVERLYPYMGGILREMKAPLLQAGGIEDHIHLLVSLGRENAVADLVRVLKSNSSRWIHETFPERSFAWQTGYGAFAVSYSNLDVVRAYIRNQAEHHRSRSFQDEYRDLLRKHGIEWDERYVWD
jgi:putative transposase